MKYNNLIITTVTCNDHPNQEHHFSAKDMAPSEALHIALVDVTCTGSFTVAMTVLEFADAEYQTIQ